VAGQVAVAVMLAVLSWSAAAALTHRQLPASVTSGARRNVASASAFAPADDGGGVERGRIDADRAGRGIDMDVERDGQPRSPSPVIRR